MDLAALKAQAATIAAYYAEGTPQLAIGAGVPFAAVVRPLSPAQLAELPQMDVDLVEVCVPASVFPAALPREGEVLRTVPGQLPAAAYRVVQAPALTPLALSHAFICQVIPFA